MRSMKNSARSSPGVCWQASPKQQSWRGIFPILFLKSETQQYATFQARFNNQYLMQYYDITAFL